MMFRIIKALFFFLVLSAISLFWNELKAQPSATLTIADKLAVPGSSNVLVPVTAIGFQNVFAFQFDIYYNSSVLTNVSVVNINSNLGFTTPSYFVGKISISGFFPNNIPDGAKLFDISCTFCSSLLTCAQNNSMSAIEFDVSPTNSFITDANIVNFSLTFNNGSVFADPPLRILNVSTVGNGTVNVNGSPHTSPMVFTGNTTQQLQAIPSSGYIFNGWSGDISGTTNPDSLLMNANKSVTASFSSSSDPLIVNPSANPTSVCSGGQVQLNANASGGSGTKHYAWTSNQTITPPIAAIANPTVNPTVNPTTYIVTVTDDTGSADGSVEVTINPPPAAAGTITGLSTVCQGLNNVTYNVPTISNATTYVWTLPTGATGTSTTNSITVNYGATAASGNITVKGVNTCGEGVASSLAVSVNALPAAAGLITGDQSVCRGENNVPYSVPLISNASTYTWSYSGVGATITGNSEAVTISFASNATSGNLTVRGTNSCGNGVVSANHSITVNPLPSAAGTINVGSSSVCQGATGVAYSVQAIPNATSYTWSYSGTGATINGSTSAITISFASNATSGNLTVAGTNACGSGTVSANYPVTVNSLPAAPTITPGGPTTFCAGGSVLLTSSAGSSYLWSTGATTQSISVTTSGSYTVQVTNASGCLSPVSAAAVVTVNPLPVAPTSVGSTLSTICSGQSTVLSYTGGSGSTFNWYSTACGTGLVGSGNNLSVSPTSTTTYYGRWENGCGNSSCQSVTVTVNQLPVAPSTVAASSSTICSGQSTVLSYTGGSGTTFNWYSTACGTGLVGSGNNFSVSPTSTTTYYGRWENGCGNSSCLSVTITVNPLAVPPTSVSASVLTICSGQSSELSYIGGSGTTFNWYSTACGTGLVGSGNNISVSPTSTTTYYGRWENGCGNSTCQSVTITVNTLPIAPTSVTASSTTICSGQSTSLSYTGGSGATFNWYSSACGTGLVGSGNNLSVSPTSTTTYYGRWENSCGQSACQQVTVNVNPLPIAPTSVAATFTTICSGQSTVLSYSGGSGTTFNWYSSACGTGLVGSGNNFSVSPTSTTTYYGRWENGCGNSTCQSVTITVNTSPTAPTSVAASLTTICSGQSTILSYTGGSGTTFNWFSPACGTGLVGSGNNLSVSPTSTTTYYGRWENGCGNSSCQSVTITVNPLPVAPTTVAATLTTICSGQSTVLSYTGGSGSTFNWYSTACGTGLVGNGNNLSVSPTSTTTYYGRWENGCGNSSCQSVTITVNPLSVAPTTVAATLTTICSGQSTVLSYTGGSGTTFNWYSSACGTGLVGSGNNLSVSPTSTTTYYGRWENSCGNSSCQSVTITVNPLPVAPTTVAASLATICSGQSTVLSYTGGSGTTFNWYSSACGTGLVGSGNNLSVSPTSTTTYYGRWENGCGNSSCQSVTITVNPLPVAPTTVAATLTTICSGQSTVLSYTGGSGTTFNWYSSACGTGLVGSGNNLSVSPTSTTTYYGRWENSCGNSSCQSVTITVNPLPVAPTTVAATLTTICSGQSTVLSYTGGSGTTFNWYSTACGTGLVGSGNNLSVSPTSTTTYYGRWENGCGSSNCQSVTINVNPLPSTSVISGNTNPACNASGIIYSVALTSGSSYTWAVPEGAAIVFGATGPNNNQITVNFGSSNGNITVIETNSNGCVGAQKALAITLSGCGLSANFVGSPLIVCQNETVTFTSISAGTTGNTVYNWSFGAGAIPATANTAGPHSVAYSTTGSKTISLTIIDGTTSTESKADYITVNPIPVAPASVAATLTTICSGQSTILSYIGGSGTTFNWYSTACGTGFVGSGNNLSVIPTETTTYFGRWENGCGQSACQQVTVTVNPLPVAPTSVTANLTTVCSGQSTELSYTGGSGTTFNWYSTACGTGLIGSGNNLSVSPTSTTTYYGRWENDCGQSACQQVTVTVNPLPVTPTSVSATNTEICSGQSTVLSYTGGSGTTFNWYSTACGAGLVGSGNNLSVSPTSTTTYYGLWENDCGNSSCRSVTINVNPLPIVNAGPDQTVPNGGSVTLSGATASGANPLTYSWTPANIFVNASLLNPTTVSLSNTVIATLTVTDANGCQNSDQVTITVTGSALSVNPTATPQTICLGASSQLAANAGGGTGSYQYSWTSVPAGFTSAIANPTAIPSQTTTYFVTVDDGSNTVNGSVVVTVNPLPTVSCPASLAVCISAGPQTLSGGLPAGGTYSGTGVSANTFSPSIAGVGTHLITYTYTDGNGCSNSCSFNITVNALPVVNAGPDRTIPNGSNVTLSGATASGANPLTYSWTPVNVFVDAGVLNATTVNLSNTVVATLTVTDANGCQASDQVTITVTGSALSVNPTASPQSICVGETVQLTANAGGGTGSYQYSWTSVPAGFTSAIANPTVTPPQTTTYFVTVDDGSNTVNGSVVVTVNPLPTVTCPASFAVCISAGPQTLTGASPTGGTYSGAGVSANTFSPSIAGVGTHLITYTYTDSNGCINSCSFNITVNPLPVVTCPSGFEVCIDAGTQTLSGVSPSGGTYSGAGVSGNTFNPATAGVGTHLITYNYTDENGCINSCSFSITVHALPVVICPADFSISLTQQAVALTGGLPAGGTYSGTGVVNGLFDPVLAGEGQHSITYSYVSPQGCENSCTFQITVLNTFAGDANCDGVVNVLDVVSIINKIMNAEQPVFCIGNADANGDGVIDVLDVVSTINIINEQ